MSVTDHCGYEPMTLAELTEAIAAEVAAGDGGTASVWGQVKEFGEEARHEDAQTRAGLLERGPSPMGGEHRDVFLAALAEHVAMEEELPAPVWSQRRFLGRFAFPFDIPSARAEAIVHSPPTLSKRSPSWPNGCMKILAARRSDTGDIRFLLELFDIDNVEPAIATVAEVFPIEPVEDRRRAILEEALGTSGS